MKKDAVVTPLAPSAIGPYSQGVRAGGLVFVSGQIPIDPATGEIVSGGISVQTERVLQNLRAVLEASGASMDSVVKTTVYLVNLADFGTVNEIYGRAFTAPFPARATVQVAALPRGAHVEIDAIATL
jgi:2-iminobutanoate/2-iminopropanoate deaminase